jgi:transposase
MIYPGDAVPIYIATRPVDFRKGMDGLAALVEREFDLSPFSGAIFVFRSKRADRMKAILWDGTGMVLVTKRLDQIKFVWPAVRDGVMRISRSQFEALAAGLDWTKVRPREVRRPIRAA